VFSLVFRLQGEDYRLECPYREDLTNIDFAAHIENLVNRYLANHDECHCGQDTILRLIRNAVRNYYSRRARHTYSAYDQNA